MAIKFIQDPQAVLDYTLDWSNWLVEDDFLAHVSFTAPDGINILSQNVSDSVVTDRENVCATVWLSGGTVGVTYNVTCHIVTDGGREDDRTFQLVIRQR